MILLSYMLSDTLTRVTCDHRTQPELTRFQSIHQVLLTKILSQGHFDMQTRRIEPATFQQQDAGSSSEPQQLGAEHDCNMIWSQSQAQINLYNI